MGTPVAQPSTTRAMPAAPAIARTHMLLVGNMHRVGEALCRACTPSDYRLDLEPDPQAGQLQAARAGYDLIVVDLLFLARGVALCQALRSRGVRASILLLAVTGSSAEVIAGLDAGADDCIVGSVADEEVRARAAGLLRRRGLRAGFGSAGAARGICGSTGAADIARCVPLEAAGEGKRCRV